MALDLNAEKIAKLPTAQKLLILVGIVFVIFAIYYLTLESSYKNDEQRLDTKLSDLKAKIRTLREIAKEKKKFEQENEILQKKLEELKAKLPSETEIDTLLIDITKMGRDNGLVFNTFQPQKEMGAQLYVTVPISMKFSGNFFHILRFFDTVAKHDRIVNIANLRIQKGRGKDVLTVDCTAETYKFKETPAKGTK
jgi:type IV pilus assembly protein PilO